MIRPDTNTRLAFLIAPCVVAIWVYLFPGRSASDGLNAWIMSAFGTITILPIPVAIVTAVLGWRWKLLKNGYLIGVAVVAALVASVTLLLPGNETRFWSLANAPIQAWVIEVLFLVLLSCAYHIVGYLIDLSRPPQASEATD